MTDCKHEWEILREENYGQMDYSSYGGGVTDFVVTLYRCKRCGLLRKEGTGDFNGDPSELLELTEEDIAYGEERV